MVEEKLIVSTSSCVAVEICLFELICETCESSPSFDRSHIGLLSFLFQVDEHSMVILGLPAHRNTKTPLFLACAAPTPVL